MDMRVYLKVKLKSLAEESRIIRKETKKAKSPILKNGLYRHRIDIVRYEARHTHLAYGFIRGKKYKDIEPTCYEQPNWPKVRKMVEKYGSILLYWDYNTESYKEFQTRQKEAEKYREELLIRFDEWINQHEPVSN